MKIRPLAIEMEKHNIVFVQNNGKPPHLMSDAICIYSEHGGGISLLDFKKGEILTPPTRSINQICLNVKSVFPEIDTEPLSKLLKNYNKITESLKREGRLKFDD